MWAGGLAMCLPQRALDGIGIIRLHVGMLFFLMHVWTGCRHEQIVVAANMEEYGGIEVVVNSTVNLQVPKLSNTQCIKSYIKCLPSS